MIPFRREKRKIKRRIQAAMFAIACVASVSLYSYQYFFKSHTAEETTSRKLLSEDDSLKESLEEFPPLLFTYQQIKDGAWVIYFLGMFYCFVGIAVICDDYFVPAVEVIVDKLNMTEDTAGATWLAAGGSAPELFTSLVGTFIAQSDVGFGTIVGSAVFNVLFIIGACAIFTAGDLKLQWWPFARDMSYYLVCLGLLATFFGGISKNQMYWWESLILLLLYFLYVFIMKNNENIKAWFFKKYVYKNERALLEHQTDYGTEISMQEKNGAEQKEILEPLDATKPKLLLVDDNIAGKIRTASERSRRGTGKGSRTGSYISRKGKSFVDTAVVAGDSIDEDDESEEAVDLSWPDGTVDRIWYIVKAPLMFAIYFTLFDVNKEAYVNWWPWTFFGCLLWLGGLAYLMVWWAVCVGYAWNVPQEIMGLVFLAAGTSVPELFSCIIVAKKGKADMAVSASIGSNIFDILVGLPLPWLLFALTQTDGEVRIDVHAHGLFLSILVLIVMLACLLVLILFNKWILTHCMGWTMILLYLIFVAQDLIRHYSLDIEFR